MTPFNAPDSAIAAIATAALLRHPLGPAIGALQLGAHAEAALPPEEAQRWNRVIFDTLQALKARSV